MKKLLLLLPFILTFAVSGLAQTSPNIHNQWINDQNTSPTWFISRGLIDALFGERSQNVWNDLTDSGKAQHLSYNISWASGVPALTGGPTSYSYDGITYSISVTGLGNGIAQIDYKTTATNGKNTISETKSCLAFSNNPNVMFDAQGNVVDPNNNFIIIVSKSQTLSNIKSGSLESVSAQFNLNVKGGSVTLGQMLVVNPHFSDNISIPDNQGGNLSINVGWVLDPVTGTYTASVFGTTSITSGGITSSVSITNIPNSNGVARLTLTQAGNINNTESYYIRQDKPGRIFDEAGNEVSPKDLHTIIKSKEDVDKEGGGNTTASLDGGSYIGGSGDDFYSDSFDSIIFSSQTCEVITGMTLAEWNSLTTEQRNEARENGGGLRDDYLKKKGE